MRRDRESRPWPLYLLGVVAVAVAVLAGFEVGPPSSSARTSHQVVTAERGVVQSIVTGTGNVEPGTNVDANFRTGGTLQHVYVRVGQQVTEGQLLATLDPTSAQLGVEQAQESLTAAQDQLTAAENGTSTGSSGSGSGSSASYTGQQSGSEFVSYTRRKPPTGRTGPAGPRTTTTTTTTTTTVTRTAPGQPGGPGGSGSTGTESSGSGAGGSHSTVQTTTTATPNPATIASAQASVYSAEANLRGAEQTLSETKLMAPTSGTIVSMAGLVAGDSVSAGSTTTGASSSSSSSSSSSTSSLAGGSSTAGSLGSSSSSGSSSPFVEIANSRRMTMTVSFSESDISKVHVGQPATVTLDALSGVELAAHVSQISDLGSSSSGVVSYNATLTITQHDSQVKPGMSALASVITGQAQGVTVPNEAVTGAGSQGTVNLYRNGKSVSQQVVVGLKGASRTQIVSGLSAGQQLLITITLPSLSTSSNSSSSTGALGGGGFRGLGGGGFAGGGLLGGGGAFFRGGG